jgi:putrescine aminotransferase
VQHPAVERYAEHMNPAFVKLLGAWGYGRVFVRAKGTSIWDSEGREYLDFLAGYGAINLGHNPPRLLQTMRDFLSEDVLNVVHVGPQVHAADLAADLAELARPLSMALFANGGAEAVEAAIKLARAATGRKEIVYAKGGFHGTNLGSLSVMGHSRLREPFEPLVPSCVEVPFGDLDRLERALKSRRVAAFLVEPIQAEAGVVLPPRGYLAAAHGLCAKHGVLMVLDEVQTGIGRTGTLFAFENEGFVPDVLVLGKALGGSLLPVSAALTTREVHEKAYGTMSTFDLHGSTFSGFALGCRVARETLRIVREEKLAEAAAERGQRLLRGLRQGLSGHPLVREVRGRGLLVALELGPTDAGLLNRLLPSVVSGVSKHVFGQWLALRLLEQGILCQPASQQWNVLKLEPPLTVSEQEIDRVVAVIVEILAGYRELKPLLVDAGERLAGQALGGWGFR